MPRQTTTTGEQSATPDPNRVPAALTLAKRLLYERESRALDRLEFAQLTGISPNRVRTIETLQRPDINIEILDKAAERLGVALWELLKPNPEKTMDYLHKRELTSVSLGALGTAARMQLRDLEGQLRDADTDEVKKEVRDEIKKLREALSELGKGTMANP